MRTLLEVLLHIREHGPHDPTAGICHNIRICIAHEKDRDDSEEQFIELVKTWDKCSNSQGFPIPSGRKNESPSGAFYEACESGSLWSRRTKYGRLRWELVDFLIEKLQA